MGSRIEKKWHGPRVDAHATAGAIRGLKLAANHLLTESRRIVPHEWGDLERDGTPSIDESKLVALVSYSLPYAVAQHEELNWNHAPGRSAKYLEIPLITQDAIMFEIVAAQIRRELR